MAKKEYDKYVLQALNIKPIISQIRNFIDIAVLDCDEIPLMYLSSCDGLPVDRFIIIDDPTLVYSDMNHLLINTGEFISASKSIKKSMSYGKIENDWLNIYQNEEDESPVYSAKYANDKILHRFISDKYKLFSKDVKGTKEILKAVGTPEGFVLFTEEMMNQLRGNEIINLTTEKYTAMISKALFGNIKKTESIGVREVGESNDSSLLLFKQVEDEYTLYTLCRFLTIEKEVLD